jgi:hypothetical protein
MHGVCLKPKCSTLKPDSTTFMWHQKWTDNWSPYSNLPYLDALDWTENSDLKMKYAPTTNQDINGSLLIVQSLYAAFIKAKSLTLPEGGFSLNRWTGRMEFPENLSLLGADALTTWIMGGGGFKIQNATLKNLTLQIVNDYIYGLEVAGNSQIEDVIIQKHGTSLHVLPKAQLWATNLKIQGNTPKVLADSGSYVQSKQWEIQNQNTSPTKDALVLKDSAQVYVYEGNMVGALDFNQAISISQGALLDWERGSLPGGVFAPMILDTLYDALKDSSFVNVVQGRVQLRSLVFNGNVNSWRDSVKARSKYVQKEGGFYCVLAYRSTSLRSASCR